MKSELTYHINKPEGGQIEINVLALEEKKVRVAWDSELEKYFFSVVDIVNVLTESKDFLTARKYWNKLKQRLIVEGFESVTSCHQLKLRSFSDGKLSAKDVADIEQLLSEGL